MVSAVSVSAPACPIPSKKPMKYSNFSCSLGFPYSRMPIETSSGPLLPRISTMRSFCREEGSFAYFSPNS